MRFQFIPSVLVFFLINPIFVSGIKAQDNDSLLIENCFNQFQKSILELKGNAAIQFLDQKTKDYYKSLLKWVKTEKKENLKVFALLDKYNVLMIRHRISLEEIKTMKTDDFIIYAINHGLTGRNNFLGADIHNIQIQGNKAKAQLSINNQMIPYYFHFIKEDRYWKFQLLPVIKNPQINLAFLNMIEQSEKTEDEFLLDLLKRTTGKPIDQETIWNPLK